MTGNRSFRSERDTLGVVQVPADRHWGAQTQRALDNFPIGSETMPAPLIRAFGIQKWAAARVNLAFGRLPAPLAQAIARAAREVADGRLADHFPLTVWQSGSGTQTNMNLNEVIAHRAEEFLRAGPGRRSASPEGGGARSHPAGMAPSGGVHPNDHVNLSQSTNDSFPTAIHIAAAQETVGRLLPALDRLATSLRGRSGAFADLVKIGRTHLQDAVPMTLGQEFGGYARQVELGIERVEGILPRIFRLAQGGTAVGTGLNAPPGFGERFAAEVSHLTGLAFTAADDPFEAIATADACVELSGGLQVVAVSLLKIANDIRLLGSGPRCGLGELLLPENEPGSSIMPGKINPTQAEALAMVCVQVMGNHAAIATAGAMGHLELNAFRPVIALNLFQSLRLLADAAASFAERCIAGLRADPERLRQTVQRSLMLVTALTPHIGYDRAAEVARTALAEHRTLKEVAVALGYVTAADYDRWVDPVAMAGVHRADES